MQLCNVKLTGESNASYYYSNINFPRPDWFELPDIIILPAWEVRNWLDNKNKFQIREIIRRSKIPINDRIQSHTAYIDPDELTINPDEIYILKKTFYNRNNLNSDINKAYLYVRMDGFDSIH